MKSYKGLIVRYMKNEKRSVVPIFISIVLTITLITSVVFITQNIMKNEFEEKKIVFGDYDVRLQKINNERLNKIKIHENVKDFALGKVDNLSKDLVWNYNGKEEHYEMFYDVYAVEKKFFDEYINFKVVEGRLPQNEGEIVLDQKALGLAEDGSRVGRSIEFLKKKRGEDNGEKVNYTIVGIIETDLGDRLFGGKLIRLITKEEIANQSEEFEAFTYLKDPSKKEEIANDLGLKYIMPTATMTDPFGYPAAEIKYPGYNKDAYSSLIGNRLARTILAIIVFFCLTAIYNTFHTSVAKRIKVYGILRAIGGNMKQISYLIYGEALILYLVAAPIGLVLGYGLTKLESYTLINIFGLLDRFTMDFNLEVILIVLISVLFIIAIAVKSVLKKEGKLTPIEAIMDARGLTRKKKSLGKNLVGQSLSESANGVEDEEAIKELLAYDKTTFKFKLMKKLFRFEGELAHKNITRDVSANRLTKSTLFLAMAILIFFFLQIVNGTIEANNIVKSDKWDTEMSLKENKFKNNVVNDIKNINGVESVYKFSKDEVCIVVPFNIMSDGLKTALAYDPNDTAYKRETHGLVASIITLDESSIKLYDDIDKQKLDNGGVLLVNKATNYAVKGSAEGTIFSYIKSEPVLTYKISDKLRLSEDNTVLTREGLDKYYSDNRSFKDIDIVGMVDDDVLTSTYNSTNINELDSHFKILTTEEGLNKIIGGSSDNRILVKTTNNEGRSETISELSKISANNNYTLKDVTGDKLKLERNIKESLSLNIIFAITIVTMVVLNLINTSTASILSRRKELAGMRAIGMTNSQERRMIIAELFYIALSVAITVILSVGVISITSQGANLSAGKVSIVTLLLGEGLIILVLMIISNFTALAPLAQAKKFSIVEDLKED